MEEKKEAVVSIREHMKGQTQQVCMLLDELVEQMRSEETMQKATMSALASALKIVAEKYASLNDNEEEDAEGGIIVLPEIEE